MINSFRGKYAFLSNFWLCDILLDGKRYPSVEHAFQAAKTIDRGDRERIQDAKTACDAKRLGRRVKLRPGWGDLRFDIMHSLLLQKFTFPDLRALLVATRGEELIEDNTWGDRFWGTCNGKGCNHLGKLLMQVRREIGEERL